MILRRAVGLLAVASGALTASALACSSSDEPGDGGVDLSCRSEAGTDGGIPYLTALGVTSTAADSSTPMTLSPPFSPSVHDYYVRCAAGSNPLSVSMAASPGASSSIGAPTTSPCSPSQTFGVDVLENQAIVAVATLGSATTEYWVRCLPHDFPVMQWSPHPEAGTPTPGYYLVGTAGGVIGEGAFAMVLDSHGVPVWYSRPPAVPGTGVINVDNVVDGAISFIAEPAPFVTHYEIVELSPRVTLQVPVADEHELRVLRNGNYLVIRSDVVGGIDLTGLKIQLPDGGTEHYGKNESIYACNVTELAPDGKVVWQWNALDHLDPVKDCTFPGEVLGRTGPDGGKLVDAFHCNSIDVDPANGNLLVSARGADSVFYIDRSTGKILWKMGGSRYTKDNATYVPVADPFYRQHDARLQPGWAHTCSGDRGQVSVFDDHTAKPGPARGVVYDVTVHFADGGGVTDCGTGGDAGRTGASVAWQYAGSVTSSFFGSLRILPDGRRVIGWGLRDSDPLTFTEVDVAGHDLLDFTIDSNAANCSYRAPKVPLGAFDLNAMRNTAGRP